MIANGSDKQISKNFKLNFSSLSLKYEVFQYHNIFSMNLVPKHNCIIINPGYLTSLVITNNKFKSRYNYDLWNSKFESIKFLEAKIRRQGTRFRIFLDEFENSNLSSEILLLINRLRVEGIRVENITQEYERVYLKVPIVQIENKWVASRDLTNLNVSPHIETLKRLFDLLFVVLFFPFALILIVIGAFLVWLSSPGPILFKQRRVCKNDKTFNIYKLRTMTHNPQCDGSHTIENDQRIFPVGKFLRKTKIDELPQLFNILMGHMSLIGPRPERKEIVEKLDQENPYYELRHLIRPGITGWAQINDPTATPNQNFEKLEYDIFYIKNASFLLDLKIILKTIKIVLTQDSL